MHDEEREDCTYDEKREDCMTVWREERRLYV